MASPPVVYERIGKLWTEYMATYLTPEEKAAADAFAPKRAEYVQSGLKPALALLDAAKYDELGALVTGKTGALLAAAKSEMDKLVTVQIKEGKAEYSAAQGAFWTANILVGVLLCLGLLLGGLIALVTGRAISKPIAHLNEIMGKIAQGVFKREYRDHRLEWMVRSGGIDVVLDGLARDTIRFTQDFT